ncbi:hypothetical protein F6Y02_41555 (plasmid) [Bacillus megaterium]|nr:hypothetical protein [Priestia megaterium]
MSTINTLIAAFNLGIEIRKTKIGNEILESVKNLKKSLTKETWSTYYTALQSCETAHYHSFKVAYKKIESMESNDYPNIKIIMQELENSTELKSLIQKTSRLAINIDTLFLKMLYSPVPYKICDELNTLKLHRACLSLFYYLHNTKFFYNLSQNIGKEKLADPLIKEYELSKEQIPMSKYNRDLIHRLSPDESMKNSLYFIEVFESIKDFTLQFIFETHFNLNLKIEGRNFIKYKERKINKIQTFKGRIPNTVSNSGKYIIIYEEEKIKKIGLILTKITRWGENEDKCHTTIQGLIYPSNDYNLFSL